MAVATMAKRLKVDLFDLSLTLLLSKDSPGVHLGGARARASYFIILEPWDPDDKRSRNVSIFQSPCCIDQAYIARCTLVL